LCSCNCADSRKVDKALLELYNHVQAERAGTPYVLKSVSQDVYDSTGYFVQYARGNGGIFMDCGIHDIDMSRWLLNTQSAGRQEVKRVIASGLIAAHPELEEMDDCDNAFCIIEYANGTSATLHLSRTGMAGYNSSVELMGMKQNCTVSTPPSSRIKVADFDGHHNPTPATYLDRYGEAFISEMNEFAAICLDDKGEFIGVACGGAN
jgi:myo-inositol 2-dehydrogenase/D-chiro-inositol 1-dehydrogenase